MTLLQNEKFVSNAGLELDFKIDCDFLTDDDIECVTQYIISRTPAFCEVVGVPRGGCRLMNALRQYKEHSFDNDILIVDDVMTTGGSMERMRETVHEAIVDGSIAFTGNIVGWVIFVRNEMPDWINAMFKMV